MFTGRWYDAESGNYGGTLKAIILYLLLIQATKIERKYFSETYEGAVQEGQMLEQLAKDGPYTVVGTTFPKNQITPDMISNVDRGVPAVVVPTEKLEHLSSPTEFGPARKRNE
jgi:hypothetical protein